MARTKADLNSGAGLADYLRASLLARVFSAERVTEALDAHGANSQRIRRFPAVAGANYVVALSLYPQCLHRVRSRQLTGAHIRTAQRRDPPMFRACSKAREQQHCWCEALRTDTAPSSDRPPAAISRAA